MQQMVRAPKKWLREATKLVEARGTQNYKAAADILADLCEAVGGDEGVQITRKHAAHLVKKHPTLNHLKSSLRKRGVVGVAAVARRGERAKSGLARAKRMKRACTIAVRQCHGSGSLKARTCTPQLLQALRCRLAMCSHRTEATRCRS